MKKVSALFLICVAALAALATERDYNAEMRDAAKKGEIKLLKTLLTNKKVDINSKDEKGRTALMEATYWNQPEAITLLLEHGADVNLVDEEGTNALIDASTSGSSNVVKELLKKGADIRIRTKDGRTAITEAAAKGHAVSWWLGWL